MKPIDLIIPVYSGYEQVVACVESVLGSSNLSLYQIVVIYDCGPEESILSYLEQLSNQGKITLLINDRNVGFVAAVNRGMRLNDDTEIILLNSDTVVANNWIDRLADCAASDPSIGTVTPFSNSAEICSFPSICTYNELPFGWKVQALDFLFKEKAPSIPMEIPTGVGFCMYITRASLNEAGFFDEERFGRGYGEENDYCRKILKLGYRNVLCPNTYVYHHGGVSFGDEKPQLVASAMVVLDELYPDYHHAVHQHLLEDPSRPIRHTLLMEMIAQSTCPVVMHITHNMGGGTSQHIEELSARLAGRITSLVVEAYADDIVILRTVIGEETVLLKFDLHTDDDDFKSLITYLGVCRLHYHHLMGVSTMLSDFLAGLDLPHDVTLHDYYFINANPTLTNSEAVYCLEKVNRDAQCKLAYKIPRGLSPDEWRSESAHIIQTAERVISPSEFTVSIYKEYFPAAHYYKAYHPDYSVDFPYKNVSLRRPDDRDVFKIVVLGALSREKGADFLENVARLSRQMNLPYEFHLLGYAYKELNRLVITHGSYVNSDLPALIKNINPDLVWFPCRWPETYSYTLSACLREGLPIAAPDIGAFPERLRGRPLSWTFPFQSSEVEWVEIFSNIQQHLLQCKEKSLVFPQEKTTDFYGDEYHIPITAIKSSDTIPILIENLVKKYLVKNDDGTTHSFGEKILFILFQLRKNRLIYSAVKLIPFGLQRKIKRFFSAKPMHDIVRK